MMTQAAWLAISLVLMAEACLVSSLVVPWTMSLARRFGFLAHPGDRHIHREPTPVLGGVAIVSGFLFVLMGNLLLAFLLHPLLADRLPGVAQYLPNIPSKLGQLATVLAVSLGFFVLGLIDDKRGLSPWIKLICMLLLALPLPFAGVRVEGFLPWPWLGGAITVVWVVFLANSFNFLDNMDGLSAGVAAICALSFGAVSFGNQEWFMVATYGVLAGALLGFLRHNFTPAKSFMGDNGSLFVGSMIGALSILSTYWQANVPTVWPIVTPVIILGVPIFDTVSVLWIRWRAGRPLMQGDKNHFSHRLVDLGMSPRHAVLFIYIITAAVSLASIPLRDVGRVGATAILTQTALLFWIIYWLERVAQRRRG